MIIVDKRDDIIDIQASLAVGVARQVINKSSTQWVLRDIKIVQDFSQALAFLINLEHDLFTVINNQCKAQKESKSTESSEFLNLLRPTSTSQSLAHDVKGVQSKVSPDIEKVEKEIDKIIQK